MFMKRMILNVVVFIACSFVGGTSTAQSFQIGVYYPLSAEDNFGWDYGLMNLARNGCDHMVVSSAFNRPASFFAAAKNWNIKCIASYGVLNYVAELGSDVAAMTSSIQTRKNYWDSLLYAGDLVGDIVIGTIVSDEPESTGGGLGLTVPQQDFIRAYCDIYHTINNPTRSTYVNHSNPPWHDLHEDKVTATMGPIININASEIDERIAEAQGLGFANYGVASHAIRFAERITNGASAFASGFSPPFTQEFYDWLHSRTNYQDVYEMMETAFLQGANGYNVWTYNEPSSGYSLVDVDGNDHNGRMRAYGDAARDIRAVQGWPMITLARKISTRNTPLLRDRRKYPSGSITLVAIAGLGNSSIDKVVFGKSTNGGAFWTTVEDNSFPYETTFSLLAGETVILRAQAVDTAGQGSIYAASMIYVVDSSELQCGDYESVSMSGDTNKDCKVDINDFNEMVTLWLQCDDPSNLDCEVSSPSSWFCGQIGSSYPGMASDLDIDCDVDGFDFVLFASQWLECDDPVTANCP